MNIYKKLILTLLIFVTGSISADELSTAQGTCNSNNAEQCYKLGEIYSLGKGVKADDKRAYEFYQMACDYGYMAACHNLGVIYKFGTGVETSIEKSREFYEKACNGGLSGSCSQLGDIYYVGDGAKINYSKAFIFYRKSCRGGITTACEALNKFETLNDEIRKPTISIINSENISKRVKFYTELCEKSDSIGCFKLAEAYRNSKNGTDIHKAIEFYEKACKLNSMESCEIVGRLFYEGKKGLEKNYSKAEALFEKACLNGQPKSCYTLGYMYEFGVGVKKNKEKLVHYYKASCDKEHSYGWACFSLGTLYFNGLSVEKNILTAINYYERSCNNGNVFGCNELGKINNEGMAFVKKDQSKAKEFYTKACLINGMARGLCEGYRELNY